MPIYGVRRGGTSTIARSSATNGGGGALDNVKALAAYQSWAKNGYFNSDYNALKYDQSAAEFAKGNGVFWMGGDWDASIIKAGLGSNAAVINIPPGPSGTWAGVGGLSGPWHISSKTKYPDLAAAWLNYINASPEAQKLMYAQQQIPSPSESQNDRTYTW